MQIRSCGHGKSRGAALVASLAVVMTVAFLGAALIQVNASITRQEVALQDEKRAFYIAEAGLSVERREPEPGRVSVLGTLKGAGGGPSLMLYSHLDTVGAQGVENPFEPVVRDGRLYGRGAYDMKGGLAACLAAVQALAEGGPALGGDVIVAAVADEEVASLGMADVLRAVVPTAAIVMTSDAR